jgi:hypothetical protein
MSDDFDDIYDYLNVCSICGDCYTRSDICNSCRQQQMIDNDDLSWMDDRYPSNQTETADTDNEHDEPGYHADEI